MKRIFSTGRAVLLVAGLMLLTTSVAVQAGPRSDKDAGGSFIGVVMQELNEDIVKGLDLNTKYGVLIAEVMEDSPAEEAGIEDGDVIIEFDGQKVRNPENLKELVLKSRIGDRVKIKLIRDDDSKVVTVVVGEQPEHMTYRFESPEHEEFSFKVPGNLKGLKNNIWSVFNPARQLGVQVTGLNDDLAPYFDVDEGEGVLVLEVMDETVAAEAGIKAGDVILSIDGDRVDNVTELKEEIKSLETDEQFDIVVLRHGNKLTLNGVFEEDSDVHSYYLKGYSKPEDLPHSFDVKAFKMDKDQMEDLRVEMKKLKAEMKKMKKELRKQLREELKELEEE